jgi:hypothetical protein
MSPREKFLLCWLVYMGGMWGTPTFISGDGAEVFVFMELSCVETSAL